MSSHSPFNSRVNMGTGIAMNGYEGFFRSDNYGGGGGGGSSSNDNGGTNADPFFRDDFVPLQMAGRWVTKVLREDEAAPDADLYRRITTASRLSARAGMGGPTANGNGHDNPDTVSDQTSNAEPTSHMYFGDVTSASSPASSLNMDATTTARSGSNESIKSVPPLIRMRHERSLALPHQLVQLISQSDSKSLMGLFSEASLGWLAIDDKLYLWSYSDDAAVESSSEYMEFQVGSRRPIIAVGLVPPKVDVFKDEVEWCLVVTTMEEAVLCALRRKPTRSSLFGSPEPIAREPLELVPTRFAIPSGWVAFRAVCGTPDGRIFLGGQDGKLYEMDYTGLIPNDQISKNPNALVESFYDGDGDAPDLSPANGISNGRIALGKRILSIVAPTPAPSYARRPAKCQKINHSGSNVLKKIIPDFLSSAISMVFGSSTGTEAGPIIQMVLDAERQVIYTLSTRGWICAVDIAKQDVDGVALGTPKIKLASVFDVPKAAMAYLKAVSLGQMNPPSSTSGLGSGRISFAGGGEAAQAGVGGMSGARNIAKMAEKHKRRRFSAFLAPVSLHVIPRRESSRLTLLAVTSSGLRYYMTSLSPDVLNNGPLQHFGTNRATDPLAPYRKMLLCHIRAPPLLSEASNLAGSIPQVPSNENQLSTVESSWYRLGLFVVAVNLVRPPTRPTLGSYPPIEPTAVQGNIIMTISLDSSARVSQESSSLLSRRSVALEKYIAPGGICEVLSLPMASAYGSPNPLHGAASNPLGTLPGGQVKDISSPLGKESPALTLLLQSKTPSEAELNISLVPAYMPTKTTQSTNSSTARPPIDRTHQALFESLHTNNSTSQSIVAITGRMILDLMLPRKLERPALENGTGRKFIGLKYRISQQTGGYGLSAADIRRKSQSTSSKSRTILKSARLSPWQLRPAVVPLPPLAIQHLSPASSSSGSKMLLVTATGVHYFSVKSLLSQFAAAIKSAGENVERDKFVTEFFAAYGFKEGCAMSLMLAIGCGPLNLKSIDSTDKQREWAARAAFARGLKPELVATAVAGSTSGTMVSVPQDDLLIPEGYEFRPSALCEGLSTVLARLVRPIWHKPAVVVTEGPYCSAAKVELLLDDSLTESIRTPLYELQSLLLFRFRQAVACVPGIKLKNHSSMDTSDESGTLRSSDLFLQSIELRQHAITDPGRQAVLRDDEKKSIAQMAEEKSIHSFYRLLSRTNQLLSLLSYLRQVQSMAGLPEVEWGLLHGLSFAQLVQSQACHERMATLLNDLITSTSSSLVAAPSADADQLAARFSEQCYLYFSPGYRFSYEAFKAANESLIIPGYEGRQVHARKAVSAFLKAARHWNSPQLVTGIILHSDDARGVDEIATRALKSTSPLARAVTMLIELGTNDSIKGVVDICLQAAKNFATNKSNLLFVSDPTEYSSRSVLQWEKGLYHRNLFDGADSTSSENKAMAVGVNVTKADAVDTCYALILHFISRLRNSEDSTARELGWKIIEKCAESSDNEFLDRFFAHLFEKHKQDLLRVKNARLAEWLSKPEQLGAEPDILINYYTINEEYVGAADAAWGRATLADDLELSQRIDKFVQARTWRTKAVQKMESFVHSSQRVVPLDEQKRRLIETEERLEIARIQKRILDIIISSGYREELDGEVKKLKFQLLDISSLYNDYAFPNEMFGICLRIYHLCRKDDRNEIQKLWRSVFSVEILPCTTRNQQAHAFLLRFANDGFPLMGDRNVLLVSDRNPAGQNAPPSFEAGEWMKRIEDRVISMVVELYGTGADFVVPIGFIIKDLEDLQRYSGHSGTTWPLTLLADAGVPYLVVLNAYSSILIQEEQSLVGGVDPRRRNDHIRNTISFLESWVNDAHAPSVGGDRNPALSELITARVSGDLTALFTSLWSMIQSDPSLNDRLQIIDNAMRQLR